MHNFIKILFFLFLMVSCDVYSQENNLQKFNLLDGLPTTSVHDIVQDEVGYLWLATDKGLLQFDGDKFKHLTTHSVSRANALYYENKTLFISNDKGFFKINNGKTTYLGKEQVLKISSIDKEIILGTTAGVYQYKKQYLQPLKINTKINFSNILDIIKYKNDVYIATKKGLWQLDTLIKPTKINQIFNDGIINLLVNKNQLIAASYNNGLKIIENNTIVNHINTIKSVSSINKINNEIWVTSKENGIEVLDANSYTFKRNINKYNTNISSRINSVFKDNQNTIWVASLDKGLYKHQTLTNKTKPTIYIESISINYKKVDSLPIKKHTLKSTENNISFSFKSIDLKNPKSVQYRYQLNNHFTPWSSQNKVDFANLKSGDYTFIVQSKNGENLSEKKSFSFFIETPMYKKVWFLILCGVLLCLLLAGIVDVYIRRLNKKNEQKVETLKIENHLLSLEHKALQLQMNPHFIFNALNGIKALGNAGKPKEFNKTISQFSILLRSVLNNSRLEEISLLDEIKTLKNYLELEKNMNSTPFEYIIETALKNIDAEEILIPPMLLQPFVENCIKHAFQPNIIAPKITLFFEIKHQFLHFKIQDNGVGFYQSKKEKATKTHQSVALEVTKERILHLSKYHSFSIKEIKENSLIKGTEISFKIPLKTDF